MKESKIRGVVVGLRTNNTWNTREIRWFTVTLQIDIEDMADARKVTQTNMDFHIDDPGNLPSIGDLVIMTYKVVPLVDEEPPPEVEEIIQFGDEVALADPEEEDVKVGGSE